MFCCWRFLDLMFVVFCIRFLVVFLCLFCFCFGKVVGLLDVSLLDRFGLGFGFLLGLFIRVVFFIFVNLFELVWLFGVEFIVIMLIGIIWNNLVFGFCWSWICIGYFGIMVFLNWFKDWIVLDCFSWYGNCEFSFR